jgi:hypothetical protein
MRESLVTSSAVLVQAAHRPEGRSKPIKTTELHSSKRTDHASQFFIAKANQAFVQDLNEFLKTTCRAHLALDETTDNHHKM